MIDFPIDELLDAATCLQWLERQLHPPGLDCPRCRSTERRLFRPEATFPAYRCQECDRYYTVLTGTAFAKTRQTPQKLVLFLRGVAKGESTARLARELSLCYKQAHTLRHRVQNNLYETLPTQPLADPAFEADELYQNAGKKGRKHRDPTDPPRRRANKVRGHGTYATDRPPIFSISGRTTRVVRYFVREHSDAATCREVLAGTVPQGAVTLYTDEWGGYHSVNTKLKLEHATVCHGEKEWARDENGDGVREVHCNSCEGAGTGLRTYLRAFRGVHKYYLAEYVATYETMINAKRISARVVQQMCGLSRITHSSYR